LIENYIPEIRWEVSGIPYSAGYTGARPPMTTLADYVDEILVDANEECATTSEEAADAPLYIFSERQFLGIKETTVDDLFPHMPHWISQSPVSKIATFRKFVSEASVGDFITPPT
jgi:hypothetical protein